jgi:ABC-type sugar transport system ATPase subunit
MNTHQKKPIIKVRGVVKNFGGVQALKGVDLDAYSGEVHGLIGANGAGKSTLIRIIAGVHQPDAGQIIVDDKDMVITDPQHATQLGFGFIHQELNLVQKFSALQNLTLGLPKVTNWGLIDWKATRKMVASAADRVGIDFPLSTIVEDLSVGDQWLVSIARALVHKAQFIAMDEPTASLSDVESERLFNIIRELSSDGISILYVSHRLDEILEICDWVTVLKDGSRVLATDRKEVDKNVLVRAIVGGEVPTALVSSTHSSNGNGKKILLETKGLSRRNAVYDASFSLQEGEVLGIAGLVGAGRTELVRLIFGADKADSGEIFLDSKQWTPKGPHDAVKHGIAFIPEERRSQGLILDQTITFNTILPSLEKFRINKLLPFLNLGSASAAAQQISDRMRVKAENVNTVISNLSGGNQQKVVIGKWLTRDMRILILDEPSRGVDVGARTEIHAIIRELADQGVGVIMISSEVEELELPGLCDRVLVMVEGHIVGGLEGENITKGNILQLSYAHGQKAGESNE